MYFLAILLSLARLITPSITYHNPCEGKVFLNKYYEERMLYSGLHKPINLVMHDSSQSLFFSHTIRIGTQLDFIIRVCHKMKCKDIKEVIGGRAIAYDRKNNEIYLGGRKGIYKYNFTSQSTYFFAEKGKSIWNIFVQRHLYYIDSDKKKLFVYENKKFKPVAEVSNIEIDNFFVSKRLTMYYSNRTALYRAHRPVRPATLLYNKIRVSQITQDYATDVVFFASNDGMYYVHDEEKETVKKVDDITQVLGITFKNIADPEFAPGQLIYSNKNSIFTLLPGINADQCLEIRSKKSMFYMPDKNRRPRRLKFKK